MTKKMLRFLKHFGRGTAEQPERIPAAFYRDNKKRTDDLIASVTRDEEAQLMLASMRLARPPARLSEDSDGLHTHICGYDIKNHFREGCGHVWRHDGEETATGSQEYFDETHTCPACGRGTWIWKLAPDTPAVIEGNDNA